ncbi:hypothetical protein KL942_004765 [Ogataea angusta]|uniref:TauD/TfdA-like domain-containing protein n=1 Tax=Pichia angusta TaxID=870730 RepID=A0ABQ7RRV9_PICAN|nr:hypothetical protein KL942_004765 [Ogataea angusta]KAG7846309.1 hypothetical protein KL940_004593 [Ogataea angusta]
MTVLKLEKIVLPHAHVFRGREFPVAYNLRNSDDSHSPDEVAAFLAELGARGFFNEQLKYHGVVVLRHTGTTDLEVISRYVEAVATSSGDEEFEQTGVTAKRTIVTPHLSTANEGPSDLAIYQHNEFSRFLKYPSRLFFVCTRYKAAGGATPLVHGGELFAALEQVYPDFLTELGNKGLYMKQTWPLETDNSTAWRDYFCFGRDLHTNEDLETQKNKASVLVEEYVSKDYYFDENNDLIVGQHSRPIRNYRVSETESYPVLFNSIAAYYADSKFKSSAYQKTAALDYDNSEPIPIKYLDELLEQSIKLAYHHEWQEGDIAIVDNHQVSHGREPWAGERHVLVSMWDQKNKPEYEPWSRN